MKLLHEKIRKDGKVFAGNILKVDSFLNHQIDVKFMEALGEEIARRFSSCGVTKVLTVEASGNTTSVRFSFLKTAIFVGRPSLRCSQTVEKMCGPQSPIGPVPYSKKQRHSPPM